MTLMYAKRKHPTQKRLKELFYYPENDIDHINRKRSDNRVGNLREATQSCNMINTGNPCTNTPGVKGVYWDKKVDKWLASIYSLGKLKYLGNHIDFNEAVLHRLAAEQCLDWPNCDSSSPAYKYAIDNNLMNRRDK